MFYINISRSYVLLSYVLDGNMNYNGVGKLHKPTVHHVYMRFAAVYSVTLNNLPKI